MKNKNGGHLTMVQQESVQKHPDTHKLTFHHHHIPNPSVIGVWSKLCLAIQITISFFFTPFHIQNRNGVNGK